MNTLHSLNDLQKERASFTRQGKYHLIGGLVLTAIGVIGFVHCTDLSNWIATFMSTSAEATTVAGRLPYAIVATVLLTSTSALPLMLGLFRGIWFGAINLLGGTAWLNRAESVLKSAKPIEMTMNLSLRNNKLTKSWGSVLCVADLKGEDKDLEGLKIVIQERSVHELLDFERRKVSVYFPTENEPGPIAIEADGHLLIQQPTDLDLFNLLLSGKSSLNESLSECASFKAELRRCIAVLIIVSALMLPYVLYAYAFSYNPWMVNGGILSQLFLPLLLLIRVGSLLNLKSKLRHTESHNATVRLFQGGNNWSLDGPAYRALVDSSVGTEAINLDPKQCITQKDRFNEETVQGKVYRERGNKRIIAVNANGNTFFRRNNVERLMMIFLPFAFLIAVVTSNYDFLFNRDLPDQVPSGLTSQQYYSLGSRYVRANKYQDAQKALILAKETAKNPAAKQHIETLLRCYMPLHPASDDTYDRLDKAYEIANFGKTETARETLESCIKQNPDLDRAYRQLADIYVENKDIKKAKALLDKALEINPSYVRAILVQAKCSQIEGDEAGVRHYAQIALNCDPDNRLARTLTVFPNIPHGLWD